MYHCDVCLRTLVIGRNRLSEPVENKLQGQRCPGCTAELSDNLASKDVELPIAVSFWSHPDLDLSLQRPQVKRPGYVSASSLFGLTCQLSFIDRVIYGLQPNTLTMIKGGRIAKEAAERYCVRTTLPEEQGGLGGRALFLDGGNSFDVYLFTSIAREYGLDLNHVLNSLVVSRAFTPYQLLHLVKCSDAIFDVYQPRFLVISDVFSLFTQDFGEAESVRIVQNIGLASRRIIEEREVPMVITSTGNNRLESRFDEYCDVELELTESQSTIACTLLKHPSRKPTEFVQEVSLDGLNQSLLSPLGSFEFG